MVHRIKNIGFENLHRNVQLLGVILDDLPVLGAVTRIHDNVFYRKRHLAVFLQFLKQLSHQHGILAAGNTDRHAVSSLPAHIGALLL